MSKDHINRAIWLVPPAATYQRHSVTDDRLTVFYTYAGARNPCFVSVPL